MKQMIKDLVSYRELLMALTKRNIKVRYKQSVMGFLWALFIPFMVVLSGIIVKKAMSVFSGRPLEITQIIAVTVKALPWAFFVGAVKFSANSLVGNMGLIKKIYFPREVFPLSYIITQLFDFTIAAIVLAIILAFARIGISIYLLWLPVIMFFLVLLTVGLGMILSCGNVFFRDVRYIVDVIFNFGIFLTPVFYDPSNFGKWGNWLLLNPVGSILDNINRVVVLHQPPHMLWMSYAAIFATITFFGSWKIFKKAEISFAESI